MIEYLYVDSPESIEDNLPQLKERLKKEGISVGPKIDAGAMGVAYNLPDSKVLKITTDEHEAKTSSKLIKQNVKSTAKIFRVFQFTSIDGVWFIIQEKLDPLDNITKNVLRDTRKVAPKITTENIDTLRDNAKKLKKVKSWDDLLEYLISTGSRDADAIQTATDLYWDMHRVFEKHPLMAGFFLWVWAFTGRSTLIDKAFKLIFNKPKKFKSLNNIFESIADLHDAGIDYRDTHSGNLMQKKGLLKWIDLGIFSKAKGDEAVETIVGNFKNNESRIFNR